VRQTAPARTDLGGDRALTLIEHVVRRENLLAAHPRVVRNDRFIQQALLQVLTPIFDPTFSTGSFGFRPGRSAHDAVVCATGARRCRLAGGTPSRRPPCPAQRLLRHVGGTGDNQPLCLGGCAWAGRLL
jgi:hypothetical protein